jgi:hypothetical protein
MSKPLKWWLLLYLAIIGPYLKTYLLNLLFWLLDSKWVWYLLPTNLSIFIIYVNYGIGIRVWGCLRLRRDFISFSLSLSLSLFIPPTSFPFAIVLLQSSTSPSSAHRKREMKCEGNVTLLLEIRDLEEIQERCTRSFFFFVHAEDLRYGCTPSFFV